MSGRPRVGSLFAGVEGFGQGLEQAGFEVAWQVEIDKDAVSVLERHYPTVRRYRDVREVRGLHSIDKRNGSSPDLLQFTNGDSPMMDHAVTVGAENDSVLQTMRTATSFGNDVVGIAGGFPPAAAHALVTEPATNGLHPGAAIRVGLSLGDDVGSSAIPGISTYLVPPFGPGSQLTGRRDSALMPPNESVTGLGEVTASASAGNRVHTREYTAGSPGELEPVDVIVGGFPCQDLSVAGKQVGLSGARSGLFWEIVRIVGEMREATNGRYPAIVVLENVPGLLSSGLSRSNPGGDFALVLRGLQELGAAVAYRILDAQFFGVPQRRRRVFIVADFAPVGIGERRAAEILSLFEGMCGHSQESGTAGEGAPVDAESGAHSYSESGQGWWRHGIGAIRAEGENRPSRPSSIVTTPVAAFGGNRQSGALDVATACNAHGGPHGRLDFESETFVVGAITPGAHPGSYNGQDAYTGHEVPCVANSVQASAGHHGHSSPRGDGSDNLVVGAVAFHLTQDPINGGTRPAVGAGNRDGCATVGVATFHEAQITSKVNRTRVEPGRPADTLNGDARIGLDQADPGGMTVRRLMPVEVERLMGFPDGWTRYRADGSEIPDGPRYRLCGNAVVTSVAAWIGRRLRAALERAS